MVPREQLLPALKRIGSISEDKKQLQNICMTNAKILRLCEELGVDTVSELCKHSRNTLLAKAYIGVKTISRIEAEIKKIGAHLND